MTVLRVFAMTFFLMMGVCCLVSAAFVDFSWSEVLVAGVCIAIGAGISLKI